MALYDICIGKNSTKVGTATGRNPQTAMEWVYRYNGKGSEAIVFPDEENYGSHPRRGLNTLIHPAGCSGGNVINNPSLSINQQSSLSEKKS